MSIPVVFRGPPECPEACLERLDKPTMLYVAVQLVEWPTQRKTLQVPLHDHYKAAVLALQAETSNTLMTYRTRIGEQTYDYVEIPREHPLLPVLAA